MAKRYCLLCRKESDSSEYESCPHCGAMGKWAQPVEDVDQNKCPPGECKMEPVFGGTAGKQCTACGRTEYDISFEEALMRG